MREILINMTFKNFHARKYTIRKVTRDREKISVSL